MTDPTHKHHEGLEHQSLRDFLAEAYVNNKLSGGLYAANARDASIRRNFLLDNIKRAEEALQHFDRGYAIRTIMTQFGWSEHDVSEEVDYNSETYRSFIGTEAEKNRVYGKKRRK